MARKSRTEPAEETLQIKIPASTKRSWLYVGRKTGYYTCSVLQALANFGFRFLRTRCKIGGKPGEKARYNPAAHERTATALPRKPIAWLRGRSVLWSGRIDPWNPLKGFTICAGSTSTRIVGSLSSRRFVRPSSAVTWQDCGVPRSCHFSSRSTTHSGRMRSLPALFGGQPEERRSEMATLRKTSGN